MDRNQLYDADARNPYGPEDRFIYVAKIPSLQELASYQIALAIRYGGNSRYLFDNRYSFRRETNDCEEQIESLELPRTIEDMIRNCMENVITEVSDWIHNLDVVVSDDRHPDVIRPININWCVWLNGKIDYLKTARKMLETGKLSEIQKFILICVYCMEDEIKLFSLDALPERTDFYEDEIMFYWLCYLKNELYKVPLENHTSVDVVMARRFFGDDYHDDVDFYPGFAVEYFWHRIGEEDQLTVISEWISSRCLYHFECAVAERLIHTMSWPQQRRLLSRKSNEILGKFTAHSSSTECALWAWKFCKDEMSAENFTRFVKYVFNTWNDYKRSNENSALIEIWETAHDFQRNLCVVTEAEEIILCGVYKEDIIAVFPTIRFKFVLKFLQAVPVEDRKNILLGNAAIIAEQFTESSKSLKMLLNIGLPCPADVMMFKKLFIESDKAKRTFFSLMLKDYEESNRFLEFYLNEDVNAVQEFKINCFEYISSDDCIRAVINSIYDVENWKNFEKCIDETFSDDPLLALKKKQLMIESMIASHEYWTEWLVYSNIRITMEIADMAFANEELRSIKRVFAHYFEESFKTLDYWIDEEEFNEINFQRITEWCVGNDEKTVLEYKKRVSHGILDRKLHQINKIRETPNSRTTDSEILLGHLNRCLKVILDL